MSNRFSFANMFNKKSEPSSEVPQKKSSILGKPSNKPVKAVALDNFKKIRLPDTFAQEILDNDILFETEQLPNYSVAQKLTQLYMLGVEYYSSVQDSNRMQYFQSKLHTLMQSSKFFQSQQEIKQKEITEISKHAADVGNVKEVLSNLKQNVQQIDVIVQHEISVQEDQIKKRLEERRNKSQQRSMGRASSQPVIEKPQTKQKQQIVPLETNKDRTITNERLGRDKQSLEQRVNRFAKREKRGSLEQDHIMLQFQSKKLTSSKSLPIL